MADPIRAALERLVKAAERVEQTDPIGAWWWLDAPIAAARAALDAASDGPAPVTERDVREWINSQPLWHGATRDELTHIVMRALARWGRPAPAPTPAAEEVGEFVAWLRSRAAARPPAERATADRLRHAATLLEQQQGRIAELEADLEAKQLRLEPVPVSERLPGAEDCDEQGRRPPEDSREDERLCVRDEIFAIVAELEAP